MYPRFIERRVRDALSDTRVVLLAGPRQAGKTTLAQGLAGGTGMAFLTLDNATALDADADRRPGRFLLTGSADLTALPRVADSLAGRMEVVRLLPLAQAELRGAAPPDFLDRAFEGEVPAVGQVAVGEELAAAVLAGGYPEVLSRASRGRRQCPVEGSAG